MSKEFKFTIGADPEFNIEMNDKKLSARETITALLSNSKVFQKSEEGGGFELKAKKAGDIGWDGHDATGEIRPAPSNNPSKVIENLRDLFTEFHKVAPLFELSTLSRTGVVGGHIHYEVDAKPGERLQTTSPRMKLMHKKISSFYLPIMMGENKVNMMLRIKGNSYGRLCGNSGEAYRVERKFDKPNGDPGFTYELRVPTAEWLTTPKIATATLAYLGVIFNEVTRNPKNFDKMCKDILIRTDQQGDALQILAIAEYKSLTMTLFNKIKKYIKTFELYEEFKEEINYILNPIKVLADKQAANYDIRIGWGLKVKEKEASEKMILSDKAFKKEANNKDLDVISQFVKIGYNEDINVESFAKILAKRSIAFNWNLNKSYFLFGIRKGIKDYLIVNSKNEIIRGEEQIKTSSDNEGIQNLISKMRNKAECNDLKRESEKTKLNFITGKLEKKENEVILIGIPYEKRVNNEYKEFIKLAYEIDKDKLKKIEKKEKTLINDHMKSEEEKGEIWKIMNGIESKNRSIAENTEISPENEGNIECIIDEMIRTDAELERIVVEN